MKRVYFLMVMLPLFVCTSCADDEDNDKQSTLNKTSLTMYYEETEQLTVSGAKNVKWETSDDFVAKVSDNGFVTAKHVGSCIITANELKCNVIVKPKHELYPDPYLNWGASKSDVKSKLGNPDEELSNSFSYKVYIGTEIGAITYMFERNKLAGVGVLASTKYSSEISSALIERYNTVKVDPNGDIIAMFMDSNTESTAKTVVGIQLSNTKFWMILYIPANLNRSIDLKKTIAEYSKNSLLNY